MSFSPRINLIIISAATVWLMLPLSEQASNKYRVGAGPLQACPSGHSEARLTGWMLNNKTPRGNAEYDETTRQLKVSVESVSLSDGKVLAVLIGDDRIGELSPLKAGVATAILTQQLSEGARVRVFDADRPIVSANLQCVQATAAPTVPPPSPSPSPSPSESPTASPSVSPDPTSPTPDPMPKRSPAPSPSPGK